MRGGAAQRENPLSLANEGGRFRHQVMFGFRWLLRLSRWLTLPFQRVCVESLLVHSHEDGRRRLGYVKADKVAQRQVVPMVYEYTKCDVFFSHTVKHSP